VKSVEEAKTEHFL